MTISYEETTEFSRDLKKLSKKFPLLKSDLETVKKNAIELSHIKKLDNKSVFEINGIGNTDKLKFYKVKKFACRNLKGRGVRSGMRLIYALFPLKGRVVFLEIYFKAKQENEKTQRIFAFIQSNTNPTRQGA
ncbi:MAG: hypothetical protein ABIJ22_01565 [Patescibacteria group bacterium]